MEDRDWKNDMNKPLEDIETVPIGWEWLSDLGFL